MSSLGTKDPRPRTKIQNKENEKRHKYVRTNTQIQNTISPYQLKSHTHIHKQYHQQQIFTKPRTPPITTIHKRHIRAIIAHSAQQIQNFTLKLITHTITILNIHNYKQNDKK